jgi:hypothetical protein
MRKLACVLTGILVCAAVTPAKAQYFFAATNGPVVVDSGPYAYAGGPGYYASSGWWGGSGAYAYSGWWGGGAYAGDAYAYDTGYTGYTSYGWSGGGAYAMAPADEAYAAVPSCRIKQIRSRLPDGRVVIRRISSC